MPASWSTGHPELDRAIAASSQKYGVPPDVLAGIWRVESGSSFPNPYVNSSGYGGLFGTTNWNASTQAQADTAASILATQIKAHGGDVGAALYAYSGKGYTSVPGEVTGNDPYAKPARPGGGGGVLGGVEGFVGGIGHDVASPFESLWGSINSTAAALKFLTNPTTWVRAVESVFGFALILLGLYYLGHGGEGPEVDLTKIATFTAAGRVAKGATAAPARITKEAAA